MNQLVGLSGQKLVLPYYHLVSDEPPAHVEHLYEVKTIDEFKKDIEFLIKHFQPISLKELIELNKSGKKPSTKCFHLTFDDGLKEIATVIVPILKEYGVSATFFINTDFLDNKQLFYRFKASLLTELYAATGTLDLQYGNESEIDDLAEVLGVHFSEYLKKEQPYLTSEQVQQLINDGFTIGAHSVNHPLYNSITLDEQVNQTITSVNHLVDKFKLDYKVFSFPFTDDGVGRAFYDKVNPVLDLTFGTAGIKHDVSAKNLQRIPMEELRSAQDIIKSEYLYYTFKKLVGKNTIRR